jgi:trimethylamine--corrinoid protein Co-methyltransferase
MTAAIERFHPQGSDEINQLDIVPDTADMSEMIHNVSLELLKSPGVRLHDREILEQLKQHGVQVEEDMVIFTEAQVMTSLASAPHRFTLNAVNSDRNLVIGGNSKCMSGSFGAPFIMTPDNQKRQATFDDYIRLARLTHATEMIQINGGILVQPNEIDPGLDKLLMVRAALALSDKPLLGIQGSYKEVKQIMELGVIAFGGDQEFRSKPHMMFLVNTLSPLQIDGEALGTIKACAEYGQPLVITPAPTTGSTCPITPEGALVQANTEFLAGLCVAQILCPGLPVIYGCLSAQGDMRSGGVNVASPSRIAFIRLAAQMADRYNLPNRGQGVTTDAAQLSFQSGYEAMFTLSSTYTNRTDITIHGAGIMAGFAAFSYEQFVLDLELIQIMERAHKECSFSKDDLASAMDVIRQVGPGGEFLTHINTMKHCRSEPYVSPIAPIKNDDPQQYLIDLEANLEKCLQRLEQAYEKPDLYPIRQQAMDAYMANCGVPTDFLEKIV